MPYNETMATQMAVVPINAQELQLMREHPSEEFVRRYAAQVLGDANRSQVWLDSEIPALGLATPTSLLQAGDEASLRRVLKVLVRLDYGVIG